MQEVEYVQVHRFGDSVAVYFRGHETAYLSPATARQMGEELLRFAEDCDRCRFSESTLGTVYLHGEEQGQ